jgi:hypothetical protein
VPKIGETAGLPLLSARAMAVKHRDDFLPQP